MPAQSNSTPCYEIDTNIQDDEHRNEMELIYRETSWRDECSVPYEPIMHPKDKEFLQLMFNPPFNDRLRPTPDYKTFKSQQQNNLADTTPEGNETNE